MKNKPFNSVKNHVHKNIKKKRPQLLSNVSKN